MEAMAAKRTDQPSGELGRSSHKIELVLSIRSRVDTLAARGEEDEFSIAGRAVSHKLASVVVMIRQGAVDSVQRTRRYESTSLILPAT